MLAVVVGAANWRVGAAAEEPAEPNRPLTLERCLAQALRHNPEIERRRLEIERAAGGRLQITARNFPNVEARFRAGYRGGDLYGRDEPFAILTANLSQRLLDAAMPAVQRRGQLEVLIAQQQLNLTVTEQLHQVRLAFLGALRARDLIALYEQIDRRLEANVRSQEERLAAGTGVRLAVIQARSQRLQQKASLFSARHDLVEFRARLAELLGGPAGTAVAPRSFESLPLPAGQLQAAAISLDIPVEIERTRQIRPDLVLLRRVIEAARADQRTVQSGSLPMIMVTASTVLLPADLLLDQAPEVVPGRDPKTSEYRAGVRLSWLVVDNGQVRGPTERVEAIREGYEITLQRLEENVPRELALTAQALETATARLNALSAAADLAEENLKLVDTKIDLGQATQLDFSLARQDLLAVRAGLVYARYAHETARAELDRVTGRYLGWMVE